MFTAACTLRSSIHGKVSLRHKPLPRTPFMATVSKGMPYCGTKRSSMLPALPSHTTLCPICCNDCATANAGKICPPVPPAIIKNVLPD